MDTTLVILIAFWGTPWRTIATVIASSYLAKVVYEVLATPLTYAVVHALKRSEGINAFDAHTDFNPFRWRSPERAAETETPIMPSR